MTGKYFEEFEVGQTFETPKRTITEADILNFSGVSGDFNPLHVDEEFAKTTKFKRRIAQGVLTLAVLTGFWDKMDIIAGTIEAFYGIDRLRFTAPVYAGDTIRAKLKVTAKEEKERSGIVVMENEMSNQKGETVLVCTTRFLMKKKS